MRVRLGMSSTVEASTLRPTVAPSRTQPHRCEQARVQREQQRPERHRARARSPMPAIRRGRARGECPAAAEIESRRTKMITTPAYTIPATSTAGTSRTAAASAASPRESAPRTCSWRSRRRLRRGTERQQRQKHRRQPVHGLQTHERGASFDGHWSLESPPMRTAGTSPRSDRTSPARRPPTLGVISAPSSIRAPGASVLRAPTETWRPMRTSPSRGTSPQMIRVPP